MTSICNEPFTWRQQYIAEFKAKVVLGSPQRDTTIEAVPTKYGLSNSMIHRWREEFNQNLPLLFGDKRNSKAKAQAQGYPAGESPDNLKRIIGDLAMQNDILKKCRGYWIAQGRQQDGTGDLIDSAQWPLELKPGGSCSELCGELTIKHGREKW